MGLTKQYLRFARGPVFGLVGTSSSINHLPLNGVLNRYVAVSACEDILVWDLHKSEKVLTLNGEKSAVTSIACSPNLDFISAGYADGLVRIFNLINSESTVLHAHKSAVTTIDYNENGSRIVTGSNDTEIAVWDMIDERGIVRFKGHKDPITRCRFMRSRQSVIVSSSKDSLIKFWDLDINHCFFTLTGHRNEVWDFIFIKNEALLVAGCNDNELHVWNIEFKDSQLIKAETTADSTDGESEFLSCKLFGTISRHSNGRVVSLHTDCDQQFLACHGPGPLLDIYQIKSEEDISHTLRRRRKKERKKLKEAGENCTTTTTEETPSLTDYITSVTSIKGSGKIKAFDITVEKNNIKIYLLLHNNSIETFVVDSQIKNSSAMETFNLWRPGHRNNIRAISFSSDNIALLSGSSESIKIWNRASQNCIRTMDCSQVTCLSFTPGDRHCLVGTKTGKLQLFDIASAELLQSQDAHSGTIWSMCLSSDQKGFVTGSADKDVKFWNFDLVNDELSPSGKLSFQHTRTLQTPDDVLCVKFSPDNRLLAVALLDRTIKVFFVDTLKMFLSMYGHALPVLSMDISCDGTLLVSGSADRNIKIWGMDFGDCHHSLFAHDDSVTCVQFIPKTHMFFTCGNDKMINQWDADSFQKITKLQGHQGKISSLGISPNGKYLVSASDDKSIRLWERTDEPLVLEEEREREREEEDEKQLNVGENNTVIVGVNSEEAKLAARHTVETIKAIERLMEALDIYDEEKEKLSYYEQRSIKEKNLPKPQVHILMQALNSSTPLEFMLITLKKIKSSELDEAILSLNFDYMSRLIQVLSDLLDDNCEVELVCKCLFVLMRVHYHQIVNGKNFSTVIKKLKETACEKLSSIKDAFNLNLSALRLIKQKLDATQEVLSFQDTSAQVASKRKHKRSNSKTVKRAILTL